MFRTRFSVWDVFAAGLVLVAAAVLFVLPFFSEHDGEILVVTTPAGSTEYRLSEDREIVLTSRDVTLTVCISDGEAYVVESNCRDGVCKNSGRISRAGETILCAPAGVTLTVRGGDGDVDFVAG